MQRTSKRPRLPSGEQTRPDITVVGGVAEPSGVFQLCELRHPDGTPTHDLFGIKAGAGWKGAVAEVTTTEYVNGEPRRLVQRFRAYASPAESFADYAALMKSQPRYQAVRDAGSDARAFASSLQRAGYATDPMYADKLSGAIATAQRLRDSNA